ncbi:MAG: hypothetical protein ACP5GL_00385 [Infirmifilum sp.]
MTPWCVGRKASILLGVGGVYPALWAMFRAAFMSALASRPHRWHGEALDAYSRALSLAGGLNLHPGGVQGYAGLSG